MARIAMRSTPSSPCARSRTIAHASRTATTTAGIVQATAAASVVSGPGERQPGNEPHDGHRQHRALDQMAGQVDRVRRCVGRPDARAWQDVGRAARSSIESTAGSAGHPRLDRPFGRATGPTPAASASRVGPLHGRLLASCRTGMQEHRRGDDRVRSDDRRDCAWRDDRVVSGRREAGRLITASHGTLEMAECRVTMSAQDDRSAYYRV